MGNDELEKKAYSAENNIDSGLYEALMAHGIHNDNLIWNQFQILLALQGAGIVAGYALRTSWPAPVIMLGTAFLTVLLFFFILRTEEDRDVNKEVMEELAKRLVPKDIQDTLRNKGLKEPFVRWAGTPPKWRRHIRAIYVIRAFFIVFLICDIVLAVFYTWNDNVLASRISGL